MSVYFTVGVSAAASFAVDDEAVVADFAASLANFRSLPFSLGALGAAVMISFRCNWHC